ncbi:hypothetical protein ASF62_10735 [Leifsonia sp. Leaf325]|nr:acyltransferase [Leifsonia sp. Leaf325]KQQ94542.1 hypothetical protein ASF62_10735 [Leifsonia sp. Leaf325]
MPSVPSASASLPQRIAIVDYYRFAAAAMVLGYHYFFGGMAGGKVTSIHTMPIAVEIVKYGYMGVDLFFLISGFVIAQSALGKTTRQFVVGRVVRLYPAFWVCLIITSLFALRWGGELMSVTWPQFIANLTMMPTVFGYAPVDGVYWTLLYELKFYALVAVLVFLGLGRRLDVIMSVWAIGMAVLTFAAPALASRGDFLGNYYLLFAGGAIIAAIRANGWSPLRVIALTASYVGGLQLELHRAHLIEVDRGLSLPNIAIITLTTTFFAAMLLTRSRRVSAIALPASALLGGLTYPIYLLHAHIGYMMLQRFATDSNKLLVYPLLIGSVILAAYGVHRLIEINLRTTWRRLFDGSIGRLVGAVEYGRDVIFRRRKPERSPAVPATPQHETPSPDGDLSSRTPATITRGGDR